MPKRASIVWTRPALNSLLKITRYIQSDKPAAARHFADAIKAKVARLERFPDSGRIVHEFPASGLREVLVGDYRVIYRVRPTSPSVQILAVRHGAQLLEMLPGLR